MRQAHPLPQIPIKSEFKITLAPLFHGSPIHKFRDIASTTCPTIDEESLVQLHAGIHSAIKDNNKKAIKGSMDGPRDLSY